MHRHGVMAPPVCGAAPPLFACPRPARPGVMAPPRDVGLELDHATALRTLFWCLAFALAIVQLLLHAAPR